MDPKQEPKYRAVAPHYPKNDGLQVQVTEGYLINRASGERIPDDEPVFVFRARDKHARHAIAFYGSLCSNPQHRDIVQKRLDDFEAFAAAHPDRMKEPDSP